MQKNKGPLDMTKGSPLQLTTRFALPMMIGSIFQSLYTLVDQAVLGRYVGSHALAAIGATASTMNFLLLIATGVTSAFSIIISQYVGAHNLKKVKDGISCAIWMTLGLGVVVALVGVTCARPLMLLLDTPEDIIDMSVLYIQLIAGFSLAQFAYNSVASVLRSLGDSKTPLIFLIVSSVLNVILDLLAVLVLQMGVAGVAFATIAAQAISAAICIYVMFKKHPELRLRRSEMVLEKTTTKRVLSMGAQMALQSALLSVGMMVITRIINGHGASTVAAFTVGSGIQNLAVMLFGNFSFGFSVYVGQNFGARDAARIRLGVRQIALLVGGLSAVSAALSLIFAEPLVGLYVKPEEVEVAKNSIDFVRAQSWFFPFLGWIWLYNGTLKGMGKIGITMVSSFVELGSKIGLSLLLPMFIGLHGIWLAAPIGWVLGLIPDLIYYYSGRWVKAVKKPLEA